MTLITLLSIAQVIIQSVAFGFGVKIYQQTKLLGWTYICGALAIMILRRVTALLSQGDLHPWLSDIDKVILPLAISLLLLKGIYEVHKHWSNGVIE